MHPAPNTIDNPFRDRLDLDDHVELNREIERLEAIASRGGGAREWALLKLELSRLVGWDARDPALRTAWAYERIYSTLLEAFENAGGRF